MAIRGTVRYPLPNTIAFGGVPAGSAKSQLAATVAVKSAVVAIGGRHAAREHREHHRDRRHVRGHRRERHRRQAREQQLRPDGSFAQPRELSGEPGREPARLDRGRHREAPAEQQQRLEGKLPDRAQLEHRPAAAPQQHQAKTAALIAMAAST